MSQLGYQLKLVAGGLRRDRGYSWVMVISLALSVSLLVTALATYLRFNSASTVRLPGVYRVQPRHNPLEPFYDTGGFRDFASFASFGVTAQVERAIAASDLPAAHTASFMAAVTGGAAEQLPEMVPARFCDRDLFGIFATSFRFGGPWPNGVDVPPHAAVLNAALNDRWFRGANSVGRTLIVEGRRLTVVGVLAPPALVRQIWDFNPFTDRDELLVPTALAEDLRPIPLVMFPPSRPSDWSTLVAGPQRFMESWVSLPDQQVRARFVAFVAALDPTLEVVSADALIARLLQNPAPYTVFAIFTAVLVVANVLNAVRLLFARALARSAELGIHRALGAPRSALFTRHLLEDLVVVTAGSTLGVAVGIPAVRLFELLIPDLPPGVGLDPPSVLLTWTFCLLLGLMAGLYPAARVAFVLPTRHLGRV